MLIDPLKPLCTGLETNNNLMDSHFPGSTPLEHGNQSTSFKVNKVDELSQTTCLRQDTEDVARH